jgi:RNA polymerase sigma factor (sigma-70 family)
MLLEESGARKLSLTQLLHLWSPANEGPGDDEEAVRAGHEFMEEMDPLLRAYAWCVVDKLRLDRSRLEPAVEAAVHFALVRLHDRAQDYQNNDHIVGRSKREVLGKLRSLLRKPALCREWQLGRELGNSLSSQHEDLDLRLDVEEALFRLSAEKAEIVRALYLERRSLEAVAASLGVSESTVRRRQRHALAWIKEFLSRAPKRRTQTEER